MFKIGLTMGTNPYDYDCPIRERVMFGDNVECEHPNYISNSQPIMVDGEIVGVLYERYPHDWKEDETHSFMVQVDEVIDSDHFIEDENRYMAFAKLTDLLVYLKLL